MRTFSGLLSVVLFLLITALPDMSFASDEDREAWHSPARLSGIHGDKQFLAGSEVYVQAEVEDDIFAAGGEVRVRDTKAADLFLAGGFVNLRGVEAQDGIMAGGEVDMSGRFSGDVIAAGGSLEMEPDTEVAGDVLMAGGRLGVSGRIAGTLRAAGGQVRIDGPVDGDVYLAGGRLVLGPNARIGGNLSYSSGEEIEIAGGARVAGEVTRRPGVDFAARMPGVAQLIVAGVLTWIGVIVSLIVLGAVLLAAFPRLVAGASDTITLRPLPSLALGVVLMVAVPIAAAIAMATAIGLPLGLFALLLYALALATGLIAAALWIGQYLPKLRGRHAQHTEYRWCLARVAAGLVVLGLVVLVPFLGGLALAIAGVLGLGGVAVQGWTLIGKGAGSSSA
ncbi:bactofilin family protein [Ferruginivarius sediminum]|uniref:bactofilin family protein n=1 Tax=Ferruginivarius sediminum TaxID=2661937 RepID=UPI0011C079F6|nr:polymer-forming cytoskeletal protein [Ferruginivarius sediminum]